MRLNSMKDPPLFSFSELTRLFYVFYCWSLPTIRVRSHLASGALNRAELRWSLLLRPLLACARISPAERGYLSHISHPVVARCRTTQEHYVAHFVSFCVLDCARRRNMHDYTSRPTCVRYRAEANLFQPVPGFKKVERSHPSDKLDFA